MADWRTAMTLSYWLEAGGPCCKTGTAHERCYSYLQLPDLQCVSRLYGFALLRKALATSSGAEGIGGWRY